MAPCRITKKAYSIHSQMSRDVYESLIYMTMSQLLKPRENTEPGGESDTETYKHKQYAQLGSQKTR